MENQSLFLYRKNQSQYLVRYGLEPTVHPYPSLSIGLSSALIGDRLGLFFLSTYCIYIYTSCICLPAVALIKMDSPLLARLQSRLYGHTQGHSTFKIQPRLKEEKQASC